MFLQARPLKEPVSLCLGANRVSPSVQRFHDPPHSFLSFFSRASSSFSRLRTFRTLRLGLANFNLLENRQVVVVSLRYLIRFGFASNIRRRFTGRWTVMACSYNSFHLRIRKRRIRPNILAKLWEWVRSPSPMKNPVKEPHFVWWAKKVRGTEISPKGPGKVQSSTQLSHSPVRRVENSLTKTICRFIFDVSDTVELTSHKRNCATSPSNYTTWPKISKAITIISSKVFPNSYVISLFFSYFRPKSCPLVSKLKNSNSQWKTELCSLKKSWNMKTCSNTN